MHNEISKSKHGLPAARFPQGVDLAVEARKSRRRLYPVTLVYTAFAQLVLLWALLGEHPVAALAWFASGACCWTYIEYLAHRHVLHGRFPEGRGLLRRLLHHAFDHLHYEHHERPWDGNHINGTLRDTLPIVLPAALLSLLAPLHTIPVLLGGILQFYIFEEWVHHSVHFYAFKGRYFRYIKKHHLYHHSPRGSEVGFGLSNGFWDVVRGTRIPVAERRLLYGRRS
jgi:hypothetical protein